MAKTTHDQDAYATRGQYHIVHMAKIHALHRRLSESASNVLRVSHGNALASKRCPAKPAEQPHLHFFLALFEGSSRTALSNSITATCSTVHCLVRYCIDQFYAWYLQRTYMQAWYVLGLLQWLRWRTGTAIHHTCMLYSICSICQLL